MVTKLKDAKGRAFAVIPAAQLDQALVLARKVLKTADITPKACAVLATNNAQVPEGSTYAAGASLSASDKTVTTVTVFAVKDVASMASQMSASKKAVSQCSVVTISIAGKKVTSRIVPVDVSTSGDVSLGALTTETSAAGAKATTLSVSGIKGNLAATAVKTGTAVSSSASAELVKLVNSILANG
ncbi:hypothetical protein IV498_01410 [Paenarthrobacter sp. Z7-10]|uniref:hypothetical protein n=1 Tax=Paenarthrobacter sp. Z7-10 TaxID=2787635 RepID=UPI0022A8E0D4|nr:hypothetical protein [Paenarthrobacter sp. Z7-10]MCZ2401872.1 hypothetical protein [Paenarthrobacter sp. Z7-10]